MRKICQKTILGIFHVKGTFSKSQLDCWKRYFARSFSQRLHPVVIDLFKVNNGSIRTIFEICLKITKTLERRHRRRCGVFIVNFIVLLLLTDFIHWTGVSIIGFKQAKACWVLEHSKFWKGSRKHPT